MTGRLSWALWTAAAMTLSTGSIARGAEPSPPLSLAPPNSVATPTTSDARGTRPSGFPRLVFRVGEPLEYEVQSERIIVPGTSATSQAGQRSAEEYRLRIVPVAFKDGHYRLRIEIPAYRRVLRADGRETQEFSLVLAPRPGEQAELALLREALTSAYDATLTPGGRLTELRRAGRAAERPDPGTMAAMAVIDQFARTTFSWLPTDASWPTGSWSRKEELPLGGMPLERKNDLRIESISGDRVEVRSLMTIRAKKGAVRIEQDQPGEARIVFHAGRVESLEATTACRLVQDSVQKDSNSAGDPANSLTLRARVTVRRLPPAPSAQ